jgi:hypothetical protein
MAVLLPPFAGWVLGLAGAVCVVVFLTPYGIRKIRQNAGKGIAFVVRVLVFVLLGAGLVILGIGTGLQDQELADLGMNLLGGGFAILLLTLLL